MRQCLRIWANSSACVAAPRQSRPGSATTRIAPTAPRAPSALRPVRVPVRIAPTARCLRPRPSRCGGNGALAGKNRAACIPFSPSARKRPPPWQYLREMHASRDQDGKILALCVHFRAQSGDSGCMARESCHQGPLFASRARKSCMARRCCQRLSAPAGPRTGRTGFVPCGPGLVRLPHARASAISPVPPLLAPGVRHLSLPFARPRRTPTLSLLTAAFIAASLHVAPAVLTMPPATSPIAVGGGLPIGRFPRTPASRRPAASAPPWFPQFPRNSAVIQLPIQENFVSKDKQ